MTILHEVQDSSVSPDTLHRDQLTEIFETHYDYVVGYLERRFFPHDPQTAEDIAQETFVKVVDKIQTFKGEASIKTWITSIAIRKALDYLNKKSNRSELPTETDQLDSPSVEDQASVLDRLELEGFVERSALNVERLKDAGWTDKEIAAAKGIKVNTLKSQIKRSRDAAKQLIGHNPELLN